MTRSPTSETRWVLALVACGVIIRLVPGLARGEELLLRNGYEFYVTISRNFLDGHGLCYAVDGGCAARMPLYPLWLSMFLVTGGVYPGLVIAQSVVGAALTWIAWDLGRRLFDRRVGLIAAAAAALSPYAVVHDTVLQDTVLVNVLMAAALLLLLRGQESRSGVTWFCAGTALAAAVLTNARIGLFVPCALAWVAVVRDGDWREKVRSVGLVALPILVLLGGWTMRNWRVEGAPVLTTEAGEQLWFANNPLTFTHFPIRSIDLTIGEINRLPRETFDTLDHFPGSDAARDAQLADLALDYITADPARTAIAASRKIWVAASAQLSPAREPVVQLGYALVFLPVHVLALLALWRSRQAWRTHSLAWLLLLSFALTTALFWAHTSHKSYLDPVLFVYAAAGAYGLLPGRRMPEGATP